MGAELRAQGAARGVAATNAQAGREVAPMGPTVPLRGSLWGSMGMKGSPVRLLRCLMACVAAMAPHAPVAWRAPSASPAGPGSMQTEAEPKPAQRVVSERARLAAPGNVCGRAAGLAAQTARQKCHATPRTHGNGGTGEGGRLAALPARAQTGRNTRDSRIFCTRSLSASNFLRSSSSSARARGRWGEAGKVAPALGSDAERQSHARAPRHRHWATNRNPSIPRQGQGQRPSERRRASHR